LLGGSILAQMHTDDFVCKEQAFWDSSLKTIKKVKKKKKKKKKEKEREFIYIFVTFTLFFPFIVLLLFGFFVVTALMLYEICNEIVETNCLRFYYT